MGRVGATLPIQIKIESPSLKSPSDSNKKVARVLVENALWGVGCGGGGGAISNQQPGGPAAGAKSPVVTGIFYGNSPLNP